MNTNHFILKTLSTKELTNIANTATTEWLFLQTEAGEIEFLPQAEKRFIDIAEATGAAMVYSDYYQITEDGKNPITTIEYQRGSLRDDFNSYVRRLRICRIVRHTAEDIRNKLHFSYRRTTISAYLCICDRSRESALCLYRQKEPQRTDRYGESLYGTPETYRSTADGESQICELGEWRL